MGWERVEASFDPAFIRAHGRQLADEGAEAASCEDLPDGDRYAGTMWRHPPAMAPSSLRTMLPAAVRLGGDAEPPPPAREGAPPTSSPDGAASAQPGLEIFLGRFLGSLREREQIAVVREGEVGIYEWRPRPDGARESGCDVAEGDPAEAAGAAFLRSSAVAPPPEADPCPAGRASGFQIDRHVPAVRDLFTSRIIRFEHPMNRGVLSWNALTPGKSSVEVELRARSERGVWSEWFTMGVWGERIASHSVRRQKTPSGMVALDMLMLREGARDWQYRIIPRRDKCGAMPTVHAVGLAVKNTKACREGSAPAGGDAAALAVPALSQFESARKGRAPRLARRICSPTSVAMLLRYHGVTHLSPVQLATRIYDRGARIFGNWSFNAAALFAALNAGRPEVSYLAYARWFDSFDELLEHVRRGEPAIVNIAFKRGALRGAPVATSGHILLVRGADREYVYVNDPAFRNARSVPARYARDEFIKAWKGGAFVVERADAGALAAGGIAGIAAGDGAPVCPPE